MIWVVLLYALCASTFTLSKAILQYCPPFLYIGIRMLLAGGFIYLYARKHTQNTFQKAHFSLFAQIILFHIFFAYTLELWGLQYVSSIESAYIFNLSPFITALFSYYWFNEKMTLLKVVGLLLGWGSLIPLMTSPYASTYTEGTIVPALAIILCVISSAYGWVVFRVLIKDHGYSASYINCIGMLGGGVLSLALSCFTESWNPFPITHMTNFIFLLGQIILIANIVFYNMYGFLLKKYTATFLSFSGFLCPFFAALFGWYFLGEDISEYLLIALLLIITGLYLFHKEELRQHYIQKI